MYGAKLAFVGLFCVSLYAKNVSLRTNREGFSKEKVNFANKNMKSKGTILIVDDNGDILFTLQLLLRVFLDKVITTTDPGDIPRLYKEHQPDCVLLDMNFHRDKMDCEEGFYWLDYLLKHDSAAVVIMMTAFGDVENAVRAIKSGAQDFITKPWDNGKIVNCILAGVEKGRAYHESAALELQKKNAALALVETSQATDETLYYEKRYLQKLFEDLVDALKPFQDESGMFYQVVNRSDAKGNYLETSGTALIAYAILKAVRLGYLAPRYREMGEKAFNGIAEKYLSKNEDGTLKLSGICLVAGLGGKAHRDGSLEYYFSEPVVENEAKGVAPFLLAYTEMLRI